MQNRSLRSTQRLLWRLITAPEGVAKALRENTGVQLPLRGGVRLSAAERLDIYANMYFFRIRDSLKGDFPAILKILGEERFHNLITDYLICHPPRHWSLRYAGQFLPHFLKSYRLSRNYPFLAALGQFEWALLTAFDASDVSVLTTAQLVQLPAADWPRLRLKLVPSAQILRFAWPVDQIFETATKSFKKGFKKTVWILIWRQGYEVQYRPLASEERGLLLQLKRPRNFQRLCDEGIAHFGQTKTIPLLAGYLKRWVEAGILQL